MVRVDVTKGVDLRIERLDAAETAVRDFDRRKVADPIGVLQFRRAELVDIGVHDGCFRKYFSSRSSACSSSARFLQKAKRTR